MWHIWTAETYGRKEREAARAELCNALALEGLSTGKRFQLLKLRGTSYLEERNIENARAEYAKVLDMEDMSPDQKAEAHIQIAGTYMDCGYVPGGAKGRDSQGADPCHGNQRYFGKLETSAV